MNYQYDQDKDNESDQKIENLSDKLSVFNQTNEFIEPKQDSTVKEKDRPKSESQKYSLLKEQKEDIEEKKLTPSQMRNIKDQIEKDFLNFGEDRPIWSPSKTKDKFRTTEKNRIHYPKKKNKTKDQDSEFNSDWFHYNLLTPLDDPSFAMHKLLIDLNSEKWEDQNNGLIAIRKLAKYHKENLYDMNLSLPHLISDICKLSFSVNEKVLFQSNITLIELVETLKGNMNIVLDPIISMIFKKNETVRDLEIEQMRKLTSCIAKHCDGNKIIWTISSIITKTENIGPFKGSIVQFLRLIIEKYKTNVIHLKNFPKLIMLLTQLIFDQTYSIRQAAKKSLLILLNSQLLNKNDFEEVLRRNLPEKQFLELINFIEKHKMIIQEKLIGEMEVNFLVE